MRVHALQLGYDDNESIDARRARAAELVAAQAGADLVVLPELWAPTGFGYQRWVDLAEPVTGPTVTAIAEAARSIGAVVHAGSFVERDETDPSHLYNTSILLGADGEQLARYRKIHRFGFGNGEPVLLQPGTEIVTADLSLRTGDDVTVGLATCYDLRFPEQFRLLLDAGARVVIVPAAWPAARVAHWSLLGRARAVENQTVMIQVNTAGTHAGHTMGGHSQIVDATGVVLAEAGPDEEVLIADIDLDAIDTARAAFPVLGDRRL